MSTFHTSTVWYPSAITPWGVQLSDCIAQWLYGARGHDANLGIFYACSMVSPSVFRVLAAEMMVPQNLL